MNITDSSLFIHLETLAYPVTLAQIKREHPNLTLPAVLKSEQLFDLGYACVEPTVKPEGQVVTEDTPLLTEGRYVQRWQVAPYSAEQLRIQLVNAKEEHHARIQILVNNALVKGALYLFSDGIEQHIQLRDGDRANLAALRIKADSFHMAGVTEEVFAFRTYENITKYLTPQQMVEMTDVAMQTYLQILSTSWTWKDQTDSATTLSGLPKLPQVIAV